MESTSKPLDSIRHNASDEECALARLCGTLVYADGFLFVYRYDGSLYVMAPPEGLRNEVVSAIEEFENEHGREPEEITIESLQPHEFTTEVLGMIFGNDSMNTMLSEAQEECETAPVEYNYDPAVLMQLTHEMAYCLKETREFLSSRMDVSLFSQGEHESIMEGGDLLDRYAKEYGIEWPEYEKQDALLRNSLLRG